MNTKFILGAIIIVGLLLRVVFINSSPPALYGDELTIALDAYSLSKTAHDQLGNLLPLTFPMGAGRPAGYVYFSVPFVALFGPTALGVRALSILSGVGIILLIYLLVKKLLSKKIALLAAGILALNPWDISLSRGGFEAHFALFLALAGTYFFINAKEKSIFYILSALSFGLALHTYPTYKISLLLFLPLLVWFIGARNVLTDIKKKYFLVGLITFIFLAIVAASQTFIAGSETRFLNINVFSNQQIKDKLEQKINYERTASRFSNSISKYFHNKPIEYTKIIIENYLQNFSADFLVLHGDRNPRHNMATMGQLYFAEVILILIGLLSFWQKTKRIISFLLFWITIGPIPTAIIDLPHALRSAFMLPPFIILSALGLYTLFNSKNKIFLAIISLFFLIQTIFFFQKLYFLAPYAYSNFWAYPAKIASMVALNNKDKYDYIFLSDKIDSLEFAYPTYARVDPKVIISQNKSKIYIGAYQFKQFDNVYLGHIPEGEVDSFIDTLDKKVLYIGSPNDKNSIKDYESIKSIDESIGLIIKRK